MIYISSLNFKENYSKYLEYYGPSDIGIEFSSGGFTHRESNYDIFKSFKGSKIIHNYFPGYQNDPFVLNISSTNFELRNRSIEHCKKNILNTALYSTEKFFAVHAGFKIELRVTDLGNKIKTIKVKDENKTFSLFIESLEILIKYCKNLNINLLIENNVLTSENYNNNYIPLFCVESKNIEKTFKKLSQHKNFGLLLDTAHLKVSCKTLGLNLESELQKIKKYIMAIHHSDNDGFIDSNSRINKNYWFLKHMSVYKNIPHVLETKNLSINDINQQIEILKNDTYL